VGEYAHQLATALVPLLQGNGRVTVFSSSWKDRLAPEAVPGADAVDARAPVRVLNRLWHRWEWPPVEVFSGPVDVAHAMHPLLIPSRHAAQVVTIHDLYFLDRPESTAAEIRRDYPALAAAHARRADAVIVVSEYTASQVQSRLGIARERISICPPGAPSWSPRAAPGSPGPVLFVGTIEPRKNVAALLTSYATLMSMLPDAPPLMLAGGVSADSAPLLAQLARPPLLGRARHLGYVSDDQRAALYRSASVLVLPSLNEGFGLPALEAMSIGVPVVAANRGALPELVGDAGLLVEPDDTDGIASAIARLLTEPDLASRSAERGIARARQFTWAATAARLVAAYRAAIERRSARS
jgi:glycosyltransferase involved in cell wall biosynthesis